MRDIKIFIMVLAVSAAVLMVAGLGFTDDATPPAGGAAMSNTSGAAPAAPAPAPAPMGTYSTPPAQ